jgi:hydroxymethylpyrimidine/phosphomethylpyrimidine kinase
MIPCALTIAGSDSGGGAGIQADLKTFAAHRVHGLSAIAALTAQHTRGVTAIELPSLAFLRAQIDACFDDFHVQAVKLGLLLGATIADQHAMHEACGQLLRKGAHAVLLKGGHLPVAGDVVDLLADDAGIRKFQHPRLQMEAHGTGCTLASAVAANLCLGLSLAEACRSAGDFVHAALRGGYRPGRSDIVILDHFGAMRHA